MDLSLWKLTLPTGKKGDPDEVAAADLAKLKNSDWFERRLDGGLRLRAPVNGVTTPKSENPRCELRELDAVGGLAKWSSSDGKMHTLTVPMAFTRLPNDRTDDGIAGVVGAQIHDAKKDVSVFRLEGSKLWVTKGNETHHQLVTDTYDLGTRFEAKYVVAGGLIKAYFNGSLVTTIPAASLTGAYFKTGAYVQANSSNSKPADATNFGEVVVFDVTVTHSVPAPAPVPPLPPSQQVIMIVRHGEKPAGKQLGFDGTKVDDHSLTIAGHRRAGALVGFFTSGRVPVPDTIVASQGKTKSQRPRQTVQPLADLLNLTIDLRYDLEVDYRAAATTLRGRAGVILVSMEHEAIIDLVKALGATPPAKTWPDDRFDVVWILVRTGTGWSVSQIPQRLLAGDRPTSL